MSQDDNIVVDRAHDHVAWVVLNRPLRGNALDRATNHRLRDTFATLDDDPDVFVIVVTGSGHRSFCAGSDLAELATEPTAIPIGHPGESRISFGGGLTGVAGRLMPLRTPTIAAVNGHAVGGGFELAMSCDVIVTADHATFSLSEGKVGAIFDSPAVHRAMRHLPYHVAMGLILTGRPLDALAAERLGLVNEVVARDGLTASVHGWAEDMMACSPAGLAALKEAAVGGLELSLGQALSTRWETVEEFNSSPDRFEGIKAFRDKRRPVWAGK